MSKRKAPHYLTSVNEDNATSNFHSQTNNNNETRPNADQISSDTKIVNHHQDGGINGIENHHPDQDGNEEPTAFTEKRKRMTQFHELSQIIDFGNARQIANTQSQNSSTIGHEAPFSRRVSFCFVYEKIIFL